MKFALLALTVFKVGLIPSALAKTPPGKEPESARIGFLRCSAVSAKAGLFHAFYFEKAGTWEGRGVIQDPEMIARLRKEDPRLDRAEKVNLTFDGRIFGSLPVKAGPVELKEKPESVREKCRWLGDRRRQPVLLTTDRKRFDDPEKWKAADLASLDLKKDALERALSSVPICGKRQKLGPTETSILGLVLGRVYRNRDGVGLIELKQNCVTDDPGPKEPWVEGFDPDWSLWVLKKKDGTFAGQSNVDLLDIGDFDGDGKSEAVFFGGYPIPQGKYVLFELTSFSPLATATDQGY